MDATPELPPIPRKSNREAILVALALIAALIGGTVWMRLAATPTNPASRTQRVYAQYVGERACRECHPGITAQFSRSGHSKTLRVAKNQSIAKILDGKTGTDPEYPNASFHYKLQDDHFTTTRKTSDGTAEELLIQYVLGSGQHAMTFVTLKDGKSAREGALEHRLTYFSQGETGRLGITPGQDVESVVDRGVKTPQGRVLSVEQTLKCLDCHVTVLSDRGPSQIDTASMIPNVSCERCHGPGRAHVEAAKRGESILKMPFGEDRESPAMEMRMCGHCHRLPEMSPPGAIREDNPELVRFQPVSLMQSKCFTETKGTLRCTTCHDPHAKTSTDLVAYESQCLSCHKAKPQAVCSVAPTSGCVGCHMPKIDTGVGIFFSDHWIRIRRDEKQQRKSR